MSLRSLGALQSLYSAIRLPTSGICHLVALFFISLHLCGQCPTSKYDPCNFASSPLKILGDSGELFEVSGDVFGYNQSVSRLGNHEIAGGVYLADLGCVKRSDTD
jgi:hypothetical protein